MCVWVITGILFWDELSSEGQEPPTRIHFMSDLGRMCHLAQQMALASNRHNRLRVQVSLAGRDMPTA